MIPKPLHVLFLCTGNSARSILAEGLTNHLGRGRFIGFSAGSHPTGRVHPLALDTLQALGCDTTGMHSKRWDVYAVADAPRMDVVITVCDNAAGESCPIWPGAPVTAHWGLPDPASVQGPDDTRRAAFHEVAHTLAARLRRLAAFPVETFDAPSLQRLLRSLGGNG